MLLVQGAVSSLSGLGTIWPFSEQVSCRSWTLRSCLDGCASAKWGDQAAIPGDQANDPAVAVAGMGMGTLCKHAGIDWNIVKKGVF